MLRIAATSPAYFSQLALHQRLCFPTLDPNDLMDVDMFAAQLAAFPEGQHIALHGERVVGQSSTFRIAETVAFAPHSYRGITGHNLFSQHDPTGIWLYGADMSVHPDYRGLGIARKLYDTRKALVQRLGLRGIVAGGALPGYQRHRDHLDVATYVAEVVAGRLVDPTLTAQLRCGFRVEGILKRYTKHQDADGNRGFDDATLLVWRHENL